MSRPRKFLRRHSPRPRSWTLFERNLAAALYDLEPGEFLVLMREGTQYFVQFADHGPYGMRVEAVGNPYLLPYSQLSETGITHLCSLGWSPPTYVQADVLIEPAEGSPNFFIDVSCPVKTGEVARVAVRTLREVYGAEAPSDLLYRAYSAEYDSIRFSQLGIKCLHAAEWECAEILEKIEPELTSSIQLPLAMPVEIS